MQRPRVVFVHGSIVGPERTWRAQQVLADRFDLVMPGRPGFPDGRGDFEVEAPAFAAALGDGAHLVGHSYGAVIALLAAALRPQAVHSLTVSEPGCLRVAPEAAETLAHGEELYRHADTLSAREFLLLFRGGVHSTHETPDPLPAELERGARHVMRERPPWEAEIPFAALRDARFPKLVISGGHSPAFEAVCDVVAARIGARRAVVRGRGHSIPSTGTPYNDVVAQAIVAAPTTTSPA
jgi:pimeloyl-ACP methyl ester carboxylesterase